LEATNKELPAQDRAMHKHLNRIIQEFDLLPKALVNVVSAYILYLMLETRGHNAKQASALMAVPESSFSRMLNRPDSLVLAKGSLKRSVRRRSLCASKF
jgi:hypothetical protein